MRGWPKHLSPVGTWATKIESWWSLVLLLMGTGGLTWIAQQWTAVTGGSWPASIFIGLGAICIVVLVASAALTAWRYFNPIQRYLPPYDPSTYSHDPAAGAPSREVYFSLLDFVIQYLWSACDAQIDLQKAIIRENEADDMIKELAIEGMPLDTRPSSQAFWIQYQNLVQGIEGSEPTLEFEALIDCINRLANGAYKNFCELSGEMARKVTVNDPGSHETLGPVWWRWAEKHNQLVDEHTKVRQNPRFGRKLYRPNRPANWGEKVAMEG